MARPCLRGRLSAWVCVALLAAVPVHAQGIRYDDLVRDALAEYAAGRFLEARALFQQAHVLKPSARTLRGLGQSAYGAQLYSRAVVELRGALDSQVNPLTRAMRREVAETLENAKTHIGRFRLALTPADAELLVDGGPPVMDREGALLLDEGDRQLIVRAPGAAERETVIHVMSGEQRRLELSAAIDAPTPAAGNDLDQPSEDTQPVEANAPIQVHEGPRAAPPAKRPFPWLAVGAFGAAAISAGVGVVEWQHRDARITSWNASGCSSAPMDSSCLFFKSNWEKSTVWGVVSFALAGAFATTGVVLLVLRPEVRTERALVCMPAGLGVGCRLHM